MSNFFQIDWILFVKNNTPTFLRKFFVFQILFCFIEEIEVLHDDFLLKRDGWLYRIRHTPQVIHIEKVLNDVFDNVERRIYINNVTFNEYIHLWPPEDENPHYLQEDDADPDNPLYLLEGDAGTISPDATVYVPVAIQPLDADDQLDFDYKIRGLVDAYKIYAINYQIIYYE